MSLVNQRLCFNQSAKDKKARKPAGKAKDKDKKNKENDDKDKNKKESETAAAADKLQTPDVVALVQSLLQMGNKAESKYWLSEFKQLGNQATSLSISNFRFLQLFLIGLGLTSASFLVN